MNPDPLFWTPPHISPPETAAKGWRALSLARTCAIRNWPEAMYRDRFYRPLGERVLYVMGEAGLREVLIEQAEIFPQSDITLRLLKPVWRQGIAASTGEAWHWQRRAAAPVFTPKSVEAVIAPAERAAREWARTCLVAPPREPVDLIAGSAETVTRVVFDTFLGSLDDARSKAEFSLWGDRLTAEMTRVNLADLLDLPGWMRPLLGSTMRKPSQALHRIVNSLVKRPPRHGSPLLAALQHARDPVTGQAMSEDLLRDNIVGTLAAGRETTALAISWALWLAVNHPPTYQRLKSEIATLEPGSNLQAADLARMPFSRQVLMEAMRLYPPAPQIARRCTRDTMIDGERVRAGTMILLPIYAIQRRPEFWTNPDAFDPDRFAAEVFDPRARRFHYLPFGGGHRICLGMAFALAEAQTILITMLRALALAPDHAATPIDIEVGATLRPKGRLTLLAAA